MTYVYNFISHLLLQLTFICFPKNYPGLFDKGTVNIKKQKPKM